MTEEILIEVYTGVDPRETMLTKGTRTGTILKEMIVGSRIVVVGISSEMNSNFDKKSLAIPDLQIEELPIDEGNLEINLSKTRNRRKVKGEN
ncbi:hypothetical protein TNCV_517121 [Trichonephila clavipes]|nr:hypothetical protein TNCV_517121 [Trichonephila clavipes]